MALKTHRAWALGRGMAALGLATLMAAAGEQPSGQRGGPKPAASPAGGPTGHNESAKFETTVRAELERNLQRLKTEPAKAVRPDLDKLFELYLAYGAIDQDSALLVDVDVARRLSAQLADPKNDSAKNVTDLLLANPKLAATFALSMRPDDNLPGAYAVLDQLAKKDPADVADRAGMTDLVVAVCVVYDKPPEHPSLGRGGPGPNNAIPPKVDPVEVFEFFKSSWSTLEFHDRLPVEMLTHVVDVHSPIEELRWAQKNYAGNLSVGKVYDSIVYDTAAFKYGQPKKVFKDGYTLPNIKKAGGVCTERAFFASEVAKAIGVPSVYITGEGNDVGHAWVGYLKNAGNHAAWDFTEGRFGEYKKMQGTVTDAHTTKETTDAWIGLTEWEMTTPRPSLRAAAAKTDAANRLQQDGAKQGAWPPAWPGGEIWGDAPKAAAHEAGIDAALTMLHGALTACPGYDPAWKLLSTWSQKGLLSAGAKKQWGDTIMKMAGRERPELAMVILAPMIQSAATPEEQSKGWDWAAGEFQARPDLVSLARLWQGQCWEKAGDSGKAWEAYKQVITRYPNDGKWIVIALGSAETLLHKTGKDASILGLYEEAFRHINKPTQMSPGFEQSSNYFMVGQRYAELLEGAGKTADAARVRRQIGLEEPGKKG